MSDHLPSRMLPSSELELNHELPSSLENDDTHRDRRMSDPTDGDDVDVDDGDDDDYVVDSEALNSLLMLAQSHDGPSTTVNSQISDEALILRDAPAEVQPLSQPAAAAAAETYTAGSVTGTGLGTGTGSRRFLIGAPAALPNCQNITLDDLRGFFHLPIAEVARQFSTCTTALKKICRKLSITKWPYRQILSLTKSIQSLEMASMNDALDDELRAQYRKQISSLRKTIADVVNNPSKIIVADTIGKVAASAGDAPRASSSPLDPATVNDAHTVNSSTVASSPRDSTVGAKAVEDESAVNQVILAATASISRTDVPKLKRKGNEPTDGASAGESKLSATADADTHTGKKHREDLPQPLRIDNKPVSTGPSMRPSLALPSSVQFPQVGVTSVKYNAHYDNAQSQFVGPVHLAPLQRRKQQPNVSRKVVPLMEPDIGSHFQIEFTPQFILSLLHRTLVDKNIINHTCLPSSLSGQVPSAGAVGLGLGNDLDASLSQSSSRMRKASSGGSSSEPERPHVFNAFSGTAFFPNSVARAQVLGVPQPQYEQAAAHALNLGRGAGVGQQPRTQPLIHPLTHTTLPPSIPPVGASHPGPPFSVGHPSRA